MLRGICILLVLMLQGPARAQVLGFSLANGKKSVQIPIEIQNNLVVLPVVLNGRLPLKFVLDTGVRNAILTEKTFSDILNLSYSRRYVIAGLGGEMLIEAHITNNVSIDLPGVTGKGHAMLVLEQDYVELRNYLGTDVHGVLGYEVFSRFVVEIDYKNKLLTLSLPGKQRYGRKFKKLAISVEDTKPYVMVDIQMNDSTKVACKLLVDSGASHGLVLESDSDPKLQPPANHVESIIGRGLGGVITGKIGRVKSLKLGSFTIPNVISNFPDSESYVDTIKTNPRVFRNGSLGGEILSRFTVAFNFAQSELYLKKNDEFKKKFYYNLSGITLKAKGADLSKFEITDIRAGSAADKAGFQVGDILITVNGFSARELDLNAINGLLNSKPGKRMALEIERGSERQKKVFRLDEDQI
jgi:hypothetical protein